MSIEPDARESPQVRAGVVAAIVAGILAILIVIAFGFQPIFGDRVGRMKVSGSPFPAPAVIPDERAERLALEARQRRDLEGANGRMPIEAAMKTIAAKGQHAFDPIGGAP